MYLFDIFSLGNEGFKHGLKEICCSEKIVKVVHDGRFLADMLKWQYGVVLANVFDTQVADMVVLANEKVIFNTEVTDVNNNNNGPSASTSKWPKSVKSLTVSCEKYLRLKDSSPAVDSQRANSETW